MGPAIKEEEIKLAMRSYFDYLSKNNLPIIIEMSSLGRVCTYSTNTDEIVSFSWLKLDLIKYCGYKEENGKTKIFFFCKIFKNIYFFKEHFDYIYQSAIKHNQNNTVNILREYIIEKGKRDVKRQIQTKAS